MNRGSKVNNEESHFIPVDAVNSGHATCALGKAGNVSRMCKDPPGDIEIIKGFLLPDLSGAGPFWCRTFLVPGPF
jgi:hypothetical protein